MATHIQKRDPFRFRIALSGRTGMVHRVGKYQLPGESHPPRRFPLIHETEMDHGRLGGMHHAGALSLETAESDEY